jgi:hypothetical protein
MRTMILAAVALVLTAPAARADEWNPSAFASQGTLELRTVGAGEGERWFKVWLVVIEGDVYVRLGRRAADRVQQSTTAPYLGVRVAGRQFDRVQGVPAPDDAGRVARAMADKYWSDVLIRHFDHPLTLRLVPEPAPVAGQR